MKKQMGTLFVLIMTLFIAGMSCRKDSPVNTAPPWPPPLPVVQNTAPKADAGQDIFIFLPVNSCALSGSAVDEDQNIDKYSWRQIAGPSTGIIERSASVQTKVLNLQKGTYEFELTVTDKGGLSHKDTVTVFVRDPTPAGSGEVIVTNLSWICPMGCSMQVGCLSCRVPANLPFRVFLRREQQEQWVEVIAINKATSNIAYVYSIDNSNNLWIYTDDSPDERGDVKITF